MNENKIVDIGCYGIVIELNNPRSDGTGFECGGIVKTELNNNDFGNPSSIDLEPFTVACDIVESMVLAQAVAGIDVTTPAYKEALETVVDQISDRFGN